MKLSIQLTIVMLIAVALAVAAVGYASFTFTKSTLIDEIGKGQQEIAKETLNTIDRVLYQKYRDIQVIADANPIESAFTSDNFTKKVEQRLDEFLLQTGPWDELELFSVDGESLLDKDRREEKHLEDHDEVGRIAFAQALQGEVYASDVLFSEEIGRPTMIFSAPIRNKDETGSPIVGVVIGKFSWPVILEILDGIESQGRHVHLFNKDGMTIATPTQHKAEILQYDLQHIPTVQQAIQGKCSSSSSSSFIFEETSHTQGDAHKEQEHIPSLSSCALQQGYLGFRSKGWGLIIETPQDIILEPVQDLTRRFILVGFIAVLLFIPLVFLLSRNITKPLSLLTQSNRDIIAGRFKEAQQQQQQQQQQRNIADEIKEVIETRDVMLKGLVGKKELDKKNKELQEKITELEKWEKVTVDRELRIVELKEKLAQLQKSSEKNEN